MRLVRPLFRMCLAASAALLMTGVGTVAATGTDGTRRALVIGTDAYLTLAPLSGAVSDALRVADVLEERGGFDVTSVIDANSDSLLGKFEAFVASVNPGDFVVVYYAGHGVQAEGRNYLIPGDFPLDASQLNTKALGADAVLARLGARSPAMKLLILDACRINPLGGAAGLAQMEAAAFGEGTRIEFAAAAGQRAQDGLFARFLVPELARPGLELEEVFRNVRRQVAAESRNTQMTLSIHQMTINFYFTGSDLPDPAAAITTLEQAAAAMPRADMGQTRAVEALIRDGRSIGGTDLLQGLSLASGAFGNGDFSRARMKGVDLSRTHLVDAKLPSTDLAFADLTGAVATRAQMTGAVFAFTTADDGHFDGVDASRSRWVGAKAHRANFSGAVLRDAVFLFADLRGAVFDRADLTGSYFIGSDLTGAQFRDAVLGNTDFTGAILNEVTLTKAQIAGGCETDSYERPDGIQVILIEEIPNSRFDGGIEHSMFLDRRYPYRLLPNGFSACKPRTLAPTGWNPIWSRPQGEQLVTSIGFALPKKVLDQPGRRAEILARVAQQFGWLWSVQK